MHVPTVPVTRASHNASGFGGKLSVQKVSYGEEKCLEKNCYVEIEIFVCMSDHLCHVVNRSVWSCVTGVVPKRSGQVQADGHQTRRRPGAVGAAVHKAGQELFGELDGLDRHRSGYVPPTAATAATALHADESQELFELVVADGMWIVNRSCV